MRTKNIILHTCTLIAGIGIVIVSVWELITTFGRKSVKPNEIPLYVVKPEGGTYGRDF